MSASTDCRVLWWDIRKLGEALLASQALVLAACWKMTDTLTSRSRHLSGPPLSHILG
jgi:hypothetical protein